MIRRYWLALLAATITLITLVWLLGPRPTMHRMDDDEEDRPDKYEEMMISPSGQYLLAQAFNDIKLFHISTGRCLFTAHDPEFESWRFGPNDELAYCKGLSTTHFYYWKPGWNEPLEVGKRDCFNVGRGSEAQVHHDKFNGLARLAEDEPQNWFLSNDAAHWVVAVEKNDLVTFELINATTGKTEGFLELPPVDSSKSGFKFLEAQFAEDNRTLLVQTSDRLIWFEVPTGRQLRSQLLPPKTRIGDACRLDRDSVVGWDRSANVFDENYIPTLVFFSRPNFSHRIALKETIPTVRHQTVLGNRSTFDPDIVCMTDNTSGTIVYSWSHQGTAANQSVYLPGYYYAARDANTGELLKMETLVDANDDPQKATWSFRAGRMHAVLPEAVMVLELPSRANDAMANLLDEWLDKLASWIPMLQRGQSRFIQLIQAHNGERFGSLHVPMTVAHCSLSNDKKILRFAGVSLDGKERLVVTFDYPLHKPWLLILCWTLGVGLTIALLVELMRRWKRRHA